VRKSLDEAGVPMTGEGGVGMAADPDGLRLQFLGAPAGLARTIIPSSRISQEEPAVQAIRFDHIMLAVSDLEKSAAHYRKIFGMEVSRTKKPESIWFAATKTRMGLETVAAGRCPALITFASKWPVSIARPSRINSRSWAPGLHLQTTRIFCVLRI